MERRPQGSVLGRDHPGSWVNWERRERLEQNLGEKKAAASLRCLNSVTKKWKISQTSSKALRSHVSIPFIQNKISRSMLENREEREGGRGKKGGNGAADF